MRVSIAVQSFALTALMLVSFVDANAVSQFARKYDLACSACHTAFPQLNSIGRKFKEDGYRFEADEEQSKKISDLLRLDNYLPLSAIIKARPYDKKSSGNKKIRAVHEVELVSGGVLAQDASYWFEVEAEDETDFNPEVPVAVATWHYNEAVNVQASYANVFWNDPYGLLSDHFRMTRGHVGVIDQNFGGADNGSGRLRDSRQNVTVFGRPVSNLLYSFSYSGKAKDAQGDDADIASGFLSWEFNDNIMVGVFGLDGQDKFTKQDFSRYGAQFLADVQDFRFQGAFVTAEDDVLNGSGSQDNDAFSLQAMWIKKDGSGERPLFVPLVRYDYHETNDGRDEFKDLTLNVTHYFTENVKGYIEYFNRLDAPSGVSQGSRFSLELQAVF